MMKTNILIAMLMVFNTGLCAEGASEVKNSRKPPVIACEFIGMADDGKEAKIKLHEPPGQRVRTLSGRLFIRDKEGKLLQMPSGYGFIPFPFDKETALVIEAQVTDGPMGQDFKKMIKEDPSQVVFSFQPRELTCDGDLPRLPRPYTMSESDNTTVVEYEMEDGDVVFTGLLKQRWGRSWVVPKDGRSFPADTSARELRFVVKITSPDGTKEKEWELYQGGVAPDKIPDDGQAWGFSIGGWTRIPAAPGEKHVPICPIELPLDIAGLDVYIIPYRVVSEQTDCILVAMAKDKQTIIDYIRALPQERGLDWENRFFPVNLPRQTVALPEPSDITLEVDQNNMFIVDNEVRVAISGSIDGKPLSNKELLEHLYNYSISFETKCLNGGGRLSPIIGHYIDKSKGSTLQVLRFANDESEEGTKILLKFRNKISNVESVFSLDVQ